MGQRGARVAIRPENRRPPKGEICFALSVRPLHRRFPAPRCPLVALSCHFSAVQGSDSWGAFVADKETSVKLWMPFYIADYLADTGRLTTQQHGAYLLLILDYWRTGPLPDDDGILAQLTKLSLSEWRKAKVVLSPLFQRSDGVWRHKRIDRELAKARANRESASRKGRTGASRRWKKSDAPGNAPAMPQPLAEAMPQAIPQAMPEHCPSPSPAPTPIQVQKLTRREANLSTTPKLRGGA